MKCETTIERYARDGSTMCGETTKEDRKIEGSIKVTWPGIGTPYASRVKLKDKVNYRYLTQVNGTP